MTDLRIIDAPSLPTEEITDELKLPTGGKGNYAVEVGGISEHIVASKDLADKNFVNTSSNGVRQLIEDHLEDLENPHSVTKEQVGLGNVDNTADLDKPVSNATQAAIITATSDKATVAQVNTKADKTYVDNQLSTKASNSRVDGIETDLEDSKALIQYDGKYEFDSTYASEIGGYPLNARLTLTNGDIVRNTVAGNTNDPNVEMSGWVNVDELIKDQRFACPEDFGYTGGDDDFGHFLQLAIDSGKNVIGSYSPVKVKSSTIASIYKSGQTVDLSMIQELEWLGNYPLYGDASTLNKAVGVINIKPSIVVNSDLSLNFSETIIVSVLPSVDSNVITTGEHNYRVGDLLIFQMTYPTGVYNSYKVGTVTNVTETTVTTDYFFAYVPLTLTVHKAKEVCEGITLKMPQKIVDNSGATLVQNLVSGCGVVYARNCKIYGTELINGTNHAVSYNRSTQCFDYDFKCTRPRMVGGGQGYTVSVVSSSYIQSHDPTNVHGRHVLDWTSSAYCKAYRPHAYNMQQIPITTHGQYEHDCEYIDSDIGDCSHLTGGRAVNIGSSGAEFGERAKRIVGIGGVLRGAIYVHPLTEGCSLKNGIEFITSNLSSLSPSGDLILNAKFSGSGQVNLQSTVDANWDVVFTDTIVEGNLDLRAGVGDVRLKGGSFRDITTTTSAKPRNILVSGGALLNPTYSPTIEALNSIVLDDCVQVRGSLPTVAFVLKAKTVTIGESVNFYSSTGLTSQATEHFNFFGNMLDPIAGRSSPLISQSTSGANVRISGTIKAFSPTSSSVYVGASVSPESVIVTGSYIEGVTNLSTNANITRCIVTNNIVKDDEVLRAATSSGRRVFQNNIY